MSEEKRTEIEEIGEFGLIDRITADFQVHHKEIIKGIGDDAAVYASGNNYFLTTSDMLLEGVHFDLVYMPLMHLGYKAIVVNISDIAAMNGYPKQVMVNLGLSNRFSVEAVEMLYKGIKTACEEYKVDLVGGDTTSSSSGLIISVTAFGEVGSNKVTYRNGAKENDILCITGNLGGAFVGLQVLEREKQEFLANSEMQPQLEKYDYVVGRQLRPKARIDIVQKFNDLAIKPTAMIDISDGLASEVLHLCKQSELGATIYEDKLPFHKQTEEIAQEFNIDSNACALNGGEDYELLFTIKQDDFEKIKNDSDIHVLGYMQSKEKGKVFVTKNKNTVPLQAQGWKHFS